MQCTFQYTRDSILHTFRIVLQQYSYCSRSSIFVTSEVKWSPSICLGSCLDSLRITVVQTLQECAVCSV